VVVVHTERTVHGGESRCDDRHDVLEVLVVCAWIPGCQVLALPILWTFLDLGQHNWQRPQPFGVHLHEEEEEFAYLLVRVEEADARYQDGPTHSPKEAKDAPLNSPLFRPEFDQLEHFPKSFRVGDD